MPRKKKATKKPKKVVKIKKVAKPKVKKPKKVKKVVKPVEVKQVSPTFLGEGPLSGEYRFAEISGSIAARSKEEAIEKAQEIIEKHPNLTK